MAELALRFVPDLVIAPEVPHSQARADPDTLAFLVAICSSLHYRTDNSWGTHQVPLEPARMHAKIELANRLI